MTDITLTRSCGFAAVLALALAQLAAAPAQATDYDVGSIHISNSWARATPKGAASGAAYMMITNNGKTSDRVSCVSSNASAGRLTGPLANVRRYKASLAHGNGKSPTDLRRDANAAWARFCACAKALPATEAQPLWRLIAAEATVHIS